MTILRRRRMITRNEIFEQPRKHGILSRRYRSLSRPLVDFIEKNGPACVDFVGCGTSYFLAMGCAKQLERLSKGRIKSSYYSGSEIMLGLAAPSKGDLLIGLSRSGTSTETLLALEKARRDGVKTAALTCHPGSVMIEMADLPVVMDFIEESAIVMTKSFTSMAFFVSALARELFAPGSLDDYLSNIPVSSRAVLDGSLNFLETLAIADFDHFVFLGYDEYFAASMEGIIKVTEMSLTEADCYQTLEYRHGPKSKVRKSTLAVVSANERSLGEELAMAGEIEKLGGRPVIISCGKVEGFANIVTRYGGKDFGDWFLRAVPLQLLGLERAIAKNLDPDRPRNLTKVVQL
jgi:glucosamine--fructose-6-phosphate aminotransferase (isomerizing)